MIFLNHVESKFFNLSFEFAPTPGPFFQVYTIPTIRPAIKRAPTTQIVTI